MISGLAVPMGSRFLHPTVGIRISGQVNEPLEERDSVSSPKPESGGVRRETVCESAGIVEDSTYGFDDDLSHSFGVFVVPQKVRRNARGTGDGQSVKPNPFPVLKPANMNADIGPAGLSP
jgi:hypothetical protein